MFKGSNIIEFVKTFDTKEKCLNYLGDIKWADGFCCPKCKNTTFSKTKDLHIRRCNKCKHKESSTSGTLFHKCKFDITKAFALVFLVSTGKKGISSTELSRKLSLRQKTCYSFKRKVMAAMASSGHLKLNGTVDVDEFFVGGYETGKVGRSKGKKKQVVMGIKMEKKGIVQCHAKEITGGGTKQLKPFFEKHVDKEAKVRTDKWRGYIPLKKEYKNLKQEVSNPKQNFRLFHRQVMMLKAWLRGIHHSVKNLQPYLDEYCYRFNSIKSAANIFHNLTSRMIKHKPVFLTNLKME